MAKLIIFYYNFKIALSMLLVLDIEYACDTLP